MRIISISSILSPHTALSRINNMASNSTNFYVSPYDICKIDRCITLFTISNGKAPPPP